LKMTYGTPLCHYTLSRDDGGDYHFVASIHHAIQDGWTIRLVMNTLLSIYSSTEITPVVPYAWFIQHTTSMNVDAARTYWATQLQGVKPALFPAVKHGKHENRGAVRVLKQFLSLRESVHNRVTTATVLRAAWAVVLAKYCDSQDICFGATISGRQAPVDGIESMPGPIIATVPIRVQLDTRKSVETFLQDVQTQASEMVSYEQFGLQNISKIGPDAMDACKFSSLFVIQPARFLASRMREDLLVPRSGEDELAEDILQGYFNYPLVIQCHVHAENVELHVIYNAEHLSELQATAIYHQYDNVVRQLLTRRESLLEDISLAGSWDLEQAISWNTENPEIMNTCFHTLVESQASTNPEAPAICAWDGNFTYMELNQAANRLAHKLGRIGVKPQDLVNVCFDKSAWHFVSILAINKAGAAWVPLEPSHPIERQRQVVSQTKATVALCSPSNASMCEDIMPNVIKVHKALDEQLQASGFPDSSPAITISPRSAMYALFTSGSTGTPKGFVMEHAAVCTSQTAVAQRIGITRSERVLQFGAFVFDITIGEIVLPLISGASIFVPSEHDRMNKLSEFIKKNSINWAWLTPSFIRTITPEEVPSLELVALAGEAVGRDILDAWFGKVRLLNGWGPAETCLVSTLHEWTDVEESPLRIGRPIGGFCWIVDPENPCQLAPIGTVGEVVIQGPTLLREYLGDQEKTDASMVQPLPSWAPRRTITGWNRAYKSGDLCSYNSDGTLEFVSRKDTQIKIRGLRVELGEVESQIRQGLHDLRHVVVDSVEIATRTNLVAYLSFTDRVMAGSFEAQDIFECSSEENQAQISELVGKLSAKLPRYMIPTYFIYCRFMPSITSTKLDRKKLKEITMALDTTELVKYSRVESKKREPETRMERQLQKLWADILKLPLDSIGRDDNFLQIGGDSIAAISLVTLARNSGISLTIKDIFDNPTLLAVAENAVECPDLPSEEQPLSPFDLIEPHIRDRINSPEMRQKWQLSETQLIEDAFPCSSMQEGLMSLTEKQPGSYIAKYVFRIHDYVDLARFQHCWNVTAQMCTNMRSRIVFVHRKSYQLVVKEEMEWEYVTAANPAAYMNRPITSIMGYGTRLSLNTVVSCADGKDYIVWTTHHAMYDGWALKIIFATLHQVFQEETLTVLRPYSHFIKYLMDLDMKKAGEYWKQALVGARKASFPPPLDECYSAGENHVPRTHNQHVNLKGSKHNSVTKASVMRAAWAVVLARYCESHDVVFGATVSGRQASIPGVESMPGPLITTVPVRVKLDQSQSVGAYLRAIQSQALEMVPYEQIGLRNIALLHPDARTAADFSSLFVVQPTAKASDLETGGHSVLLAGETERALTQDAMGNYFNYPLVVVSNMFEDNADQVFYYDARVISDARIIAISHHFEHVVQQLLHLDEEPLSHISLVGEWDKRHAIESQRLAEPTKACTHWLIQEHIKARPLDPAIVSWDRNLTYHELGIFASRLAVKLQELGVVPEVLVPICFPKSAWAVVAMVAVQMAGGAFVPLDSAAPSDRLRSIIEDSKAGLVLCSLETKETIQSTGLDINPLVVSEEELLELSDPPHPVASSVSYENASFVIFTSGSTGRPKGMLIQHDQVCTSFDAYGVELGLGPGTRVFQFCAFTFDLGIFDVLGTLSKGACICMPSDYQRLNDLAATIRSTEANWLFCTPTVVNLLHPSEVPTLKTIGLGGEAITKQVSDRWKDHVQLNGLYGPAEASSCARNPDVGRDDRPTNIGVPMSSAFWVVEPQDVKKMVPVGCIGELLIQGPMLARGYINVTPEQNAAWMEDVDWLPGDTSHRRAYRTGDLVRRNANGTYEYIGRMDSQVKIHGQRVELGEIETRIYRYLPNNMSAMVEVVRSDKSTSTDTLLAFMWYNDLTDARSHGAVKLLESISSDNRLLISSINSSLEAVLPLYMIPSTYLIFQGQPKMSVSGKVNRKALVSHASALTTQDRLRFAPEATKHEPPNTAMEFKLRSLWAQVLDITTKDIGKYDSFLRVGGDSVAAIQLVSIARSQSINLPVSAIFHDPRLCAMAEAATETDFAADAEILPFSMLEGLSLDTADMVTEIRRKCNLHDDALIEDAFPCTRLQEGLLSLTSKHPGSYIVNKVYRLPEGTDVTKFKAAWESTVDLCGILRTRIVMFKEFAIQAVFKNLDCLNITRDMDLEQYLSTIEFVNRDLGYGTPLSRAALVQDFRGTNYFVWTVHHSVFDGWTTQIILNTLSQAYMDMPLPKLQPYSRFIKYVTELDATEASSYWIQELFQAKRASFPVPTTLVGEPAYQDESKVFQYKMAFPGSTGTSITKATILRAAWAILLSKYCDDNDICFGTTVSGRHAPVSGLESTPGPMLATVPVRVRLEPGKTVSELLEDIQMQASEMVPYEQFGIQNISKLGPDAREACDFTSLIAVQPSRQFTMNGDESLLVSRDDDVATPEKQLRNYFSYPLVSECFLNDDHVQLIYVYKTNYLTETQMVALAHHYERIVQQLLSQDDTKVGDLDIAGEWDLMKSMEYNSVESNTINVVDSCLHHLFEAQVKRQPHKVALRAWDGDFTYRQLDEAANRLANYLFSELKVQIEDFVLVCFEKSAWYLVAILAINKAGGAWVPLDPSQPTTRHQSAATQTQARIALASTRCLRHCKTLVDTVVEVSESSDLSFRNDGFDRINAPRCDVQPHHAAFVLFTSGSTGTPKGIVNEHRAVCTSEVETIRRFGLHSELVVLQFASFVFDLHITESLTSFLAGASVCMPSEETRLNNLPSYIKEMGVTWAYMTPSLARTIRPEDVPGLKTLSFGGEAVSPDVFNQWFGKVQLFNGWGPAEAIVHSTIHEWKSCYESSMTIGYPVGCYAWIVDPNNANNLSPIGCLGEIVLQGPTLLREYLADPDKTRSLLLTDLPSWAPRQDQPGWSRFYKTGDLGFYNPDGSIKFSSRKDTQVKIRGQRIELGEIENNILNSLGGIRQVAVDILQTKRNKSLVAFFCFNDDSRVPRDKEDQSIFLNHTEDTHARLLAMRGKIVTSLPKYMIPTFYIMCSYMPLVTSGKMDRKTLKALAASLSQEKLATYTLVDADKRAPETEMEKKLQLIWAEILNIPMDSIGRDDSFLQIGGDSIAAITLVGAASEEGIEFTVKDVFNDPRLSAIASKAIELPNARDRVHDADYQPFSLLDPTLRDLVTMAKNDTPESLELEPGQIIEDAYPCTGFQEGLMALSVKQPGSYITHHTYRLGENVDVNRFRNAWEQTVQTCTSLRTKIFKLSGAPIQAVTRGPVKWKSEYVGMNLKSTLEELRTTEMTFGSELNVFALVQDPVEGWHFVWLAHHAAHDGWTARIVMATLHQAYQGFEPPPIPHYARFIKFVLDLDPKSAAEYWGKQLQGAHRAVFPPQLSTKALSGSTKTMVRSIDVCTTSKSPITMATILHATWAFVLARYCDVDDVCFGVSTSGRQAPISGLPHMTGPVVTTVPLRVRIDPEQSVLGFLHTVQDMATEMGTYEQFGLQNIQKLSQDAKEACNFNSLLVVQPVQHLVGGVMDSGGLISPVEAHDEQDLQNFFNYPLVIQGHMFDDHTDLYLVYNTDCVSRSKMEALAIHFEEVAKQLSKLGETHLGDISLAGDWDLKQSLSFNQNEPVIVETCVHDLIETKVQDLGERQAIDAWDGSFTYSQLQDSVDMLYLHLVNDLDVNEGDLVLACFEKSAWYIVSILAINKAGAAWVPIDSSHPVQRLKHIAAQTRARLAVTSPANEKLCASLVDNVLSVTSELNETLTQNSKHKLRASTVSARSAAYVLFTSGSTGVPKGVIIEHVSLCTNLIAMAERLKITSDVRMLQFSSFAFDFSVVEIFVSLVSGACVCVPSAHDRMNNLKRFVAEKKITWMCQTPAVARTLKPDDFPSLKLLLLGGEAVNQEIVASWTGKVRLLNAWGPTETTVMGSMHEY
ncbi:hypothetical protein V2G26_004383, partial [Clonostachys chloroleuca]